MDSLVVSKFSIMLHYGFTKLAMSLKLRMTDTTGGLKLRCITIVTGLRIRKTGREKLLDFVDENQNEELTKRELERI